MRACFLFLADIITASEGGRVPTDVFIHLGLRELAPLRAACGPIRAPRR